MPKGFVEYNIGRFAPHTWQFNKLIPVTRDDRAKILNQHFGQADDILGLGLIKPDGFDVIAHRVLAKGNHFLRAIGFREERFGGFINTDIR